MPHRPIRSRRHHVAGQQHGGHRQAGGNRLQAPSVRLANVVGIRLAVLQQQRLAQRAEQHLGDFQQTGIRENHIQIDARADATAANAEAGSDVVGVVVVLRWMWSPEAGRSGMRHLWHRRSGW